MADKDRTKESGVSRWDPFADLAPFESWNPFRDWPRFGFGRLPHEMRGRGLLSPAIDVAEAEGRYVVTAELPGCRKEDITVELHDGVLTIRGEKRDEREERGEKRHYVERSYGGFARAFRLPPDAGEEAHASFQNGVLTVEVPKSERPKPRTISIA
jgi:HSP20 family protein